MIPPSVIDAWLRQRIAQMVAIRPDQISGKEPLAAYGLTSADAVMLAADLGKWLGRKVSPTLVYEYPTLNELIAHLIAEPAASVAQSVSAFPPQTSNEPVAIIGLGCRFPGADGPEAFWGLVSNGVDAIREVPRERFASFSVNSAHGGESNAKWGGFLDCIDSLDLDFFGISEHEATRIDPQQRLLMEVSWEALEDAGLDPHQLAGSRTGVFVGISTEDYSRVLLASSAEIDGYTLLGNASSIAANRISYLLDLRGPSLAIDTACSSSLVAVHLACAALHRGECELAIAGGVNVILSPSISIGFAKAGVMAKDGRCKSFAAGADGYVRSEGAGLVVLKPLGAALRNGDRISAIIRSSAVNSDGRTNGILAPSRRAQEEVIRTALTRAGVEPRDVLYVEAHGTGTSIGDQIEAAALGSVLAKERSADDPCAIGSVKTNIGHLEAAAGIAGLIKVALAIEHRALPPSLHCAVPNPEIPFDALRLRVQRTLEKWPHPGRRAIAGVSSFGFGGTNAHAILDERPPAPEMSGKRRPVVVLPLSARTGESLRVLVSRYEESLARPDSPSPQEVCSTAAVRRGHQPHRVAFAFESLEELFTKMVDHRPARGPCSENTGVVFVFPGQGSQWVGMGRDLLDSEPAFRLAIERCEQAFAAHVRWSLNEVLRDDGCASLLDRIDVVQPAIFAIQVGLSALWRSWGVRPAAVVGHSMGEVAAAHVCGSLRLEDAARIICVRSALMMQYRGRGAMALISLSLPETLEALKPYGNHLSPAANNSPSATVVSGDPAAIDQLLAELSSRGVFCRKVNVDVASHCAQLEGLQQDVLSELRALSPRHASIPFYSSVTGERLQTEALRADYWWRNLREPVLFADAVRSTALQGRMCYLELSPHPLLCTSIVECFEAADQEIVAVPSMKRLDHRARYDSIVALYENGCDVDWSKFYDGRTRPVRLPSYPWQRQACWIDAKGPRSEGVLEVSGALPFIQDHRLDGQAIAPGAWMLDLALGELNSGDQSRCALVDVTIARPLAIGETEARYVRVSRRTRPDKAPVLSIESRLSSNDSPWEEHLSAQWTGPSPRPSVVDLGAIRDRCAEHLPIHALYEHLAASGLTYGPTMRTVIDVRVGNGEVLAQLAAPSSRTRDSWLPADVVDGAMQAIGGLTIRRAGSGTFVGFGYGRVDAFAKWSESSFAHIRLRGQFDTSADAFFCDVRILDKSGQALANFEEVCIKRVRTRHALKFYAMDFRPEALPLGNRRLSGDVLVLTHENTQYSALVEELKRAGVACCVGALPSEPEAAALLLASQQAGTRFLCLEPGREQFFSFVRAATTHRASKSGEIVLVTSNPVLPPFLRALEQETNWSGRAIQVEASELSSRELARNIVGELARAPSVFSARYRRGERLLPMLVPFEPGSASTGLRPRGVYWLTGGQGGLASTIAATLAREVSARLVLTGRSEPKREIQEAIESAGGELLYVQADATDPVAMRRARALALERFGTLNGAIHTAGVLDDALLEFTSVERMLAVLAPKVLGARVLMDAVASEELDFIVFFSSLASLFVTPGQGSYAAANAALDQLAQEARSGRTRVIAINWGPWAERGMVAGANDQRRFLNAGLHPISPEDGARAFLKVLASGRQQIVVADVRDDVGEDLVSQFNQARLTDIAASRGVAVQPVAGEKSPADFVREEVARALRRPLAQIDGSARFDRLGVDSLLAVAITRRIEAHYGISIPRTLMFTHPTVDSVALYLSNVLVARAPSPSTALDASLRTEVLFP